MNEMLQVVKTVFKLDSGGARSEMARLQAETQRQLAGIKQLEREVGTAMQDMRRVEVDLAMQALKVRSGFTNSSALSKTKFAPDILGELEQLTGGDKRMADPWMLAELERMRKVAAEAKPAIEGLGRATAGTGAAARDTSGIFAGFRERVKESLGGAEHLRSGFTLLRENFFMFAGAAWGVFEGLKALGDALTDNDEITAAYDKTVSGLISRMRELDDVNRGIRESFGAGAPMTQAQKKIAEILGTRFEAGTWQKANEDLQILQLRRDRLQEQALMSGIGLTREGLADTRGIDVMGLNLSGANNPWVYENIVSPLSKVVFEIQDLEGMMAEHRRSLGLAQAQAAIESAKIPEHMRSALREINGFGDSLGREIMSGLQGLRGLLHQGVAAMGGSITPDWMIPKVSDLRPGTSPEELNDWIFNSLIRANLYRPPKELGANIDARGSKITLNTRLETDDPARFADASLKSAFLGAITRPLAASLRFGGATGGVR